MDHESQSINSKKLTSKEFLQQLAEVKERLPKNYGTLLRHFYPDINMSQVYNVIGRRSHNEDVLEKLKKLTP
jgi:hypothetical protein